MTLRIHRQFIAIIAALAIAITGLSAVPARAGNDERAAALAMILGLAIVGTAIKHRSDNKKARTKVYQQPPKPRAQPRYVQPRQGHVQSRPLPRRADRKLLPRRCLSNLRTENGRNIQGYGQRCLNRNYQFTNALPQQCARRVQTRNGKGYAYGARCLDRFGYQLARR